MTVNSNKWFNEAKRLEAKGIVEIPGKKNNVDIMYMAKAMGAWYPNDETAWCGLYIAYCLWLAGVKMKDMPGNILGARQWKDFGDAVDVGQETEGDILVFWRGKKNGSYGHVGFYAGETKTAYRVLGGNQGNTVSYVWIAKERLLAIRRPKGSKAGPKIKTSNTSGHNLSTNEG